MDEMKFRPIDALEAKRRTDCGRNLIDNKDAIEELNHIYGLIHEAINSGNYKIRAYIHYQYVIDKLDEDKYTIKVIRVCDEFTIDRPKDKKVAIVDICWEEVNDKCKYR